MKLKLMLFVSLFAFGFAMSAAAGSVADGDTDGVPNAFDNCATVQNGPLAGGCAAQENADGDAFGDACDGDYDQLGQVNINDFAFFLTDFISGVSGTPGTDHDCSGGVNINDFATFLAQFIQGSPG